MNLIYVRHCIFLATLSSLQIYANAKQYFYLEFGRNVVSKNSNLTYKFRKTEKIILEWSDFYQSCIIKYWTFTFSLTRIFDLTTYLARPVYFLLTPRVFLCGRWHCFLTLGRSCHGAHSSHLWLLSLSPCFSIERYISPSISKRFASWGRISPWLAHSLNRAPRRPVLRNTGHPRVSDLLMTVI